MFNHINGYDDVEGSGAEGQEDARCLDEAFLGADKGWNRQITGGHWGGSELSETNPPAANFQDFPASWKTVHDRGVSEHDFGVEVREARRESSPVQVPSALIAGKHKRQSLVLLLNDFPRGLHHANPSLR